MNRHPFGPDNPEIQRASGPDCARYADLLPLVDTDLLDADERAAVRGHLAGCAACRARLASFAPVDAALRRYVDWLMVEATQPSAWLAEEDIMRLTDEETNPTHIPIEPSRYSAQRPAPRRTRPNRFLPALAALAAVLLIALSATIFALFGHGHLTQHPAQATQQPACAPSQISGHLPKGARLQELAMISPNEGWLVGSTYDSQASGPDATKSLILHYSHCQWTQESIALPGVVLWHISAISASNVWAFGVKQSVENGVGLTTTLTLHYTDGRWQQTPFPVTINSNQVIIGFRMVSANEGWLTVAPRGNKLLYGTPYQLYHGVNGMWSPVSTPGYQNLWLDKAFAPGEAWFTAEESATGQLILLLYRNGTLTPMYTLPANAFLYESYQIQMDSPQSVWITVPMDNAQGAQTGWLLLHCSLSSCSQSSLLNDPRIQTSDTVQVFSASEGWAFRTRNQQGAPRGYIVEVFRLQNGQWQRVPWLSQQIAYMGSIVQVGPDEYWAIADGSTLLHFVNGAWSSYS